MVGTMLAATRPSAASSGAMKRKRRDAGVSDAIVGLNFIAATPCNSMMQVVHPAEAPVCDRGHNPRSIFPAAPHRRISRGRGLPQDRLLASDPGTKQLIAQRNDHGTQENTDQAVSQQAADHADQDDHGR